MPRNEDIVRDRITQGLCPICGEKVKNGALVNDPVFGDVFICDCHMVKGSEKLKE